MISSMSHKGSDCRFGMEGLFPQEWFIVMIMIKKKQRRFCTQDSPYGLNHSQKMPNGVGLSRVEDLKNEILHLKNDS